MKIHPLLTVVSAILLAAGLLLLPACESESDPLDDAADRTEEAVDDTADAINEAGDEVEDAFEDATN